jgi:hypothetical protein
MLENQFFPTPKPVIERMLKTFVREPRSERFTRRYLHGLKEPYFDPNGGSGALLEYLHEEFGSGYRYSQMFACEISPELRYVLQGKGIKVVGSDFLEYDEPVSYPTILMNPPFAEGAEHVLHAWNFLADGGCLLALLNAETLKNPWSSDRVTLLHLLASQIDTFYQTENPDALQSLLEALEESEVIEWFGQCFKDSERPTNVEVVCIRLKKPQTTESYTFSAGQFETDEAPSDEEWSTNPLAHTDALENLVARYEAARVRIIARHRLQKEINFFLDDLDDPYYGTVDRNEENCLRPKADIRDQLAVLKARAWNTVFKKTKLGSKTTSDFQKKFSEYAVNQSAMAFTKQNIREMLEMFFLNKEQIMMDSIVTIFDEATKYHEKNCIPDKRWKTNKAYKCNKRIIIPYGVDSSYDMYRPTDRMRDFLNDLDKIMCFLSGKSIEGHVDSHAKLYDFLRSCKGDYQHPVESTFFVMRGFKKGTLHIDFRI